MSAGLQRVRNKGLCLVWNWVIAKGWLKKGDLVRGAIVATVSEWSWLTISALAIEVLALPASPAFWACSCKVSLTNLGLADVFQQIFMRKVF
jgi:hypothetical protein